MPIRRPVTVRPLRRADVRKASALFNKVFGENLYGYVRLDRDEPAVYGPANRRLCYGAFAGRKLVAHAAARPFRVELGGSGLAWASYGNVCTDPGWRGRGIATRINRAVWGALKRGGTDGVFISGGRGLYTRMGAAESGVYVESVLKPRPLAAIRRCLPGVTAARARRSDIGTLIALDAAQPVHCRRAADTYGPLLRDGVAYHARGAAAWIFALDGEPRAYAGVHGGRRGGWVFDYGGSRTVLLAGLAVVSKRLRLRSLSLQAARWDGELQRLLRSAGAGPLSWAPVGGTHLLLDPVRMMRRLRGHFAARLGVKAAAALTLVPAGGGYVFGYRGARHRVPGAHALTRLVMGTKPGRWERELPGRGPLRRVLEEAFPVPFPIVGLNWM